MSSDSALVWDVRSKAATPLESLMPLSWLCSLAGGVVGVRWSPAGTHMVAISGSGVLGMYETGSWSLSRHHAGSQHGNRLVDALFSPNGRYLLAAVNTRCAACHMCIARECPQENARAGVRGGVGVCGEREGGSECVCALTTATGKVEASYGATGWRVGAT